MNRAPTTPEAPASVVGVSRSVIPPATRQPIVFIRPGSTLEALAKVAVFIFLLESPIGFLAMVSPFIGTLICGAWLSLMVWVTFIRRTNDEFFLRVREGTRAISRRATWRLAGLTMLYVVGDLALQVLNETALPNGGGSSDLEQSMFRPWGWLPIFLAVVIIAPIIEEAALRGYLQGRLASKGARRSAVVATAVAFAVLHLSPTSMPYLFIVGLAFGAAMVRTGSIWVPVTLHAFGNLLVGLATLYFGLAASAADLPRLLGYPLFAFAAVFVAAAASFVWLLAQWPANEVRPHAPIPVSS